MSKKFETLKEELPEISEQINNNNNNNNKNNNNNYNNNINNNSNNNNNHNLNSFLGIINDENPEKNNFTLLDKIFNEYGYGPRSNKNNLQHIFMFRFKRLFNNKFL